MIGKVEFKKRRDFGQVINDTFTFLRQNFKQIIKVYFIFCGLFVLASMSTMLLQQYKMVNVINNLDVAKNTGRFGFSLYGVEYFLSILFSMISYSSMTVAMLSYISIYVQKGNEAPTIDEVWSMFKRHFFKVFWSAILLVILLLLGFLFCILPGFWLFPYIGMMFPIMVIENSNLIFAFNKSFQLIKNNFWITFGTLIIVWIIIYACMSMVILPTTLLSMVGIFTHKGPHMSLGLTMVTTVLQSLCQVFTILPIITVSLMYFNLVEQKEHVGLFERISNFGQADKPIDNRPEEY